jgi:hypothetical protein
MVMQKCRYCGRENQEGATLCSECGTSLAVTPESEFSPKRLERYRQWGWLGLTVGLVGLGVVSLPAVEFFFLPAGTPVRPMAWACLVMISAFVTLLVGLPCAIVGFRGGQKLVCTFALILAFAPWPAARMILQLASRICGIIIEE